jgi:hypothetical protein
VPFNLPFSVMAELVPAIHAAPLPANPKVFRQLGDADDRDKPGHDGNSVGKIPALVANPFCSYRWPPLLAGRSVPAR